MGWTRRAPAPPSRIAGSGLQNQEHSMPRTINRLEAVATTGIDIGKNTFHLVGLDRNGAIVLSQKLSRRQVEARLANMPPCLIGMEPCVGAHHLGRQLKAYGHDARLMPARYVRPYSKGQKNDFRDAEAIASTITTSRSSTRCCPGAGRPLSPSSRPDSRSRSQSCGHAAVFTGWIPNLQAPRR